MQLAVPHDREHVAAVAAQVGRDDAEREVRRDRGVHRVAAVGERRQADRAREVVRCRNGRAGEAKPASHGAGA